MIRRGRPGRHRQQAHVESRNAIIGRMIFYKLHQEELKTGKTATAWTQYLPTIVKIINKNTIIIFDRVIQHF